MRVYVTVGEESEEVEGGGVGLNVGDEGLPGLGSKHLAGLDRLSYELCALCEYLTRAESVVANLGVTHIIVAGKSDCHTVRLKGYAGVVVKKLVKSGSECAAYSIGRSFGSNSDTVHNDGENEPDMMWRTTMCPQTRRLIAVTPTDAEQTAKMFDVLLGDALQERKKFITDYGHLYIKDADI
jgi:hypothetical protein